MLMTNALCDAVIRNTNKEKFNNEDHLPFPSHVDIIYYGSVSKVSKLWNAFVYYHDQARSVPNKLTCLCNLLGKLLHLSSLGLHINHFASL